jgi:antitoxin PrlF
LVKPAWSVPGRAESLNHPKGQARHHATLQRLDTPGRSHYCLELMTQMNQIHQERRMSEKNRCNCFKVQALVGIDDRGQMVLPKEIRAKAGIRGGDKLALTTSGREGKICCILLTKSDEPVQVMQSALGPVARDLIQE